MPMTSNIIPIMENEKYPINSKIFPLKIGLPVVMGAIRLKICKNIKITPDIIISFYSVSLFRFFFYHSIIKAILMRCKK